MQYMSKVQDEIILITQEYSKRNDDAECQMNGLLAVIMMLLQDQRHCDIDNSVHRSAMRSEQLIAGKKR